MVKMKPILARILLALIFTCIGLGVGELVVRIAGVAPQVRPIQVRYADHESMYQPSDNRILGYEIKPNYRNDKPDGVFTCRHTNSHGQRDVDRKKSKSPNIRRVILLGDSVVESTEVLELDNVVHRQLEELYRGGTTEVLNFGVGGYCTLAEIELLRIKGIKFEPDVVIVVFVENDYQNFNTSTVEAFANSRMSPWIVRRLFITSHLFRLTCVRLNLFDYGISSDPAEWNSKAIGKNNVVQGLRMLREMSEEHGFTPVIAVWPVFLRDSIVDKHFMPDSDRLLIEGLAHEQGIPIVRLSDYFRRHHRTLSQAISPRTYYTVGDSMHANRQGSRVAALALKEILDDLPAATVPSSNFSSRAAELARERGEKTSGFNLAIALCDVGFSHMRDGQFGKALDHFREALRIEPDCDLARSSLGAALIEECMALRARAESNSSEPSDQAKMLRQAEQNLREALKHLEIYMSRRPDDADVRGNMGLALWLLDRKELAIPHLKRAVELRCEIATPYYILGSIEAKQGNLILANRYL